MALIKTSQRNGALWIQVGAPVGPTAAGLLAEELSAICVALSGRQDLPRCVVLRAPYGAFLVEPPASADDCDAPSRVGPWAPGYALAPILSQREGGQTRALGSQDRMGTEIGPMVTWRRAVAAVAALPCPTIAVLDGNAIGASLELALACDLRIAADTAEMGAPEILWGRIPSAGGTQRLARVVGPTFATRMLLLGEVLSAAAALEVGLIHRIAAPGELDALVEAFIAEVCAAAPIAAAYTKEAARIGSDVPLTHGLRVEADLSALLQTTDDRAEGLAAFLARRSPRFDGR